MITIKTTEKNSAEIKIEQETPNVTILLGIEMLVEALIEQCPNLTIDKLLEELRRVYERDNGGKK